jgi:hypothetical protein
MARPEYPEMRHRRRVAIGSQPAIVLKKILNNEVHLAD